MRKNVVLLLGNYYPEPSPTAKCAENYISLFADEFDIDVISYANTDRKMFMFAGKHIHPVAPKLTIFQHRIDKIMMLYPVLFAIKFFTHIFNKFHCLNNLRGYKKSAYRELDKLNQSKVIDIIFSIGSPMAAHCAAYNFKMNHPFVRWVTYSADSHAAQNNNKPKMVKFEREILSAADYNLLSEEIYNNNEVLYKGLEYKFGTLPYLLLINNEISSKNFQFEQNRVNLVYAGTFYKKIRNPEFLLRLIKYLDDDVVLHLYCRSDCDGLINRYVNASKGKIVRYETVSSNEIKQIYTAADFLVCVGNNLPEFKPSKTFEYIATGKPIINIYYPNFKEEEFDKYPAAIQLCNIEKLEKARETLRNFIIRFKDTCISQEILSTIYSKNSNKNIRAILAAAFNV